MVEGCDEEVYSRGVIEIHVSVYDREGRLIASIFMSLEGDCIAEQVALVLLAKYPHPVFIERS